MPSATDVLCHHSQQSPHAHPGSYTLLSPDTTLSTVHCTFTRVYSQTPQGYIVHLPSGTPLHPSPHPTQVHLTTTGSFLLSSFILSRLVSSHPLLLIGRMQCPHLHLRSQDSTQGSRWSTSPCNITPTMSSHPSPAPSPLHHHAQPEDPRSGLVSVPHLLHILRHAQAVQPGTSVCCPVRPLMAHLQGDIFMAPPGLQILVRWTKTHQLVGPVPVLPIPEVHGHLADPVAAYHQLVAASPTTFPDQPLFTYLHWGVASQSPSCPSPGSPPQRPRI